MFAPLNGVVRESFTDKVTFEQTTEGGEGAVGGANRAGVVGE